MEMADSDSSPSPMVACRVTKALTWEMLSAIVSRREWTSAAVRCCRAGRAGLPSCTRRRHRLELPPLLVLSRPALLSVVNRISEPTDDVGSIDSSRHDPYGEIIDCRAGVSQPTLLMEVV